MSEPETEDDQTTADDQTTDAGESVGPDEADGEAADESLTEDDYSRGATSEPDGAERGVPAGEDYAGSGF